MRVNNRSRIDRKEIASVAASFLALVVVASPARALAEAPAEIAEDGFSLPLPPDEAPPWWELELGGLVWAPLERSTLCPEPAPCLLNAGVGFDAGMTWRAADGLGIGVDYQLWALDGSSVYETTVIHVVRARIRYVLDSSARVQPFLGASLGALLLGEASEVATAGALLSVGGGAVLDLTSTFALVLDLEATGLLVGPFQTRGAVLRGDPAGFGLGLLLSVGALVRFGATVRP